MVFGWKQVAWKDFLSQQLSGPPNKIKWPWVWGWSKLWKSQCQEHGQGNLKLGHTPDTQTTISGCQDNVHLCRECGQWIMNVASNVKSVAGEVKSIVSDVSNIVIVHWPCSWHQCPYSWHLNFDICDVRNMAWFYWSYSRNQDFGSVDVRNVASNVRNMASAPSTRITLLCIVTL